MDIFEGVDKARLGRMRPGIITAIDEFDPGKIIKTSAVNSNYRRLKVGSNLKAISEAGLAEIDQSSSINKYELTDSLEPAHEMASTAYRIRIIRELDNFGEKALNPAEDIRAFGINDKKDGESMVNYNNGGYHEDTVEFLSNLDIIDNPEDRNYVSDREDRDFLEQHAEEWQIIADSLSARGQLPDRFKAQIDRYNSRFGTEFPYREPEK